MRGVLPFWADVRNPSSISSYNIEREILRFAQNDKISEIFLGLS